MVQLILASSSPYRQSLLARLGLDFRCLAPRVSEDAAPGERPAATAERLAMAKARAVAQQIPRAEPALIIGSDQVAELDGRAIGKPGDFDGALAQLTRASGRTLLFHTGLCVLDTARDAVQQACITTAVKFRPLAKAQITRYLEREAPFDCAGSFKAEGLGIALFESITSDDPTALIGLPLIRLTSFLRDAGIDPLMCETDAPVLPG